LHNPSGNADFPLVDPFFFEFGQILFNRSGRSHGSFTIKNMTIVGASTGSFDKLKTSFNESHLVITTEVSLPQVKSSGWYKSDLIINDFSLVSRGKFKLLCEEVTAKFIISGHFTDNHKRFAVDDFEMLPTVKNMKFNITHLVADENLSEYQD
jgi:Haemolymph juvenile hormone binding protein (JHBP)